MKVKKFVFAGLLSLTVLGAHSLAIAAPDKSLPAAAAAAARANEQARELAFLVAPIKTAADLSEYLAASGASNASPLKRLSDAAQRRFVESLTFNEKGLTGFNYRELEEELTYSQAYQVLALFGVQHVTPRLSNLKVKHSIDGTISTMDFYEQDYKEYECEKRATCKVSNFSICLSSC